MYKTYYLTIEFCRTYFLSRGALSIKQLFEAFLEYLADPGFPVGVGEGLGIDKFSVCRSVHYICERFVQIAGTVSPKLYKEASQLPVDT